MKIDNNVRDIIEKYIYDVVRRLPQNQRRDIELELQSILEDMMEDSEGKDCVEDILKRLGTPSELARKYRGEGNYLIGPEYYDQYKFVLKIIMICVLVGTVIGAMINMITGIGANVNALSLLVKQMVKNLSEPLLSMVSAFGIVTLIFASIERRKVKLAAELTGSHEWSVSSLPEVPAKKALLHRGESVFELVFSLGLFGILAFAPQFIGVWIIEGTNYQSIPVFNLDIWFSVFPLFLISLVLCLIETIIKLIVARYGTIVAIATTITHVFTFVVSVIIFKFFPIWNPNFVTEVELALNQNADARNDILSYWGSEVFSNMVLGIIFIALVLEVGFVFYKSVRYGGMFLSCEKK